MDGFVTDFIGEFTHEMGRQPTYEEYSQIMTGYTPAQMPVLSTLARGFATFDHWFCEVPSQTFPNRSFFHAATSSGYVLDYPRPMLSRSTTPPKRCSNDLRRKASPGACTAMRRAPRRSPESSTRRGCAAVSRRISRRSPTSSKTPARDVCRPTHSLNRTCGTATTTCTRRRRRCCMACRSMSHLLFSAARRCSAIYDAIRSASFADGSNYLNTLLLVTFDEGGGTYDHVAPPPAPPPDPAAPAGQMGFTFNRLGVRVPTIAISPWIPERTVVTEEFRHTSLIRTMRERWSLGNPLTARDATARRLPPGPVAQRAEVARAMAQRRFRGRSRSSTRSCFRRIAR